MVWIHRRAEALPPSTNTTVDTTTCHQLSLDEMVVTRSTYIAILTVCVLTTVLSLSILAVLAIRVHTRHQSERAAKTWGRKSMFANRISVMRKEVDDMYTRQYKGCWQSSVVENPEMGSDSPVELMLPERVWEVPAVPATTAEKNGRKSWKERKERMSLFFDQGVGVWVPKR